MCAQVRMQQLCANHPHVLPVVSTFECDVVLPDSFGLSRQQLAIVTTRMAGDLFGRVKEGAVTEDQMRACVYQITHALAHVHELGLVHRDVKLENVLLTCQESECMHAYLADFGLAVSVADIPNVPILYTASNIAPEMLRSASTLHNGVYLVPPNYGPASDMWALGVVLYCMAFGGHPFHDTTVARTQRRIRQGRWYALDEDDMRRLSASGHEVLAMLLSPDPSNRPSAANLLLHPWLNGLDIGNKWCSCIRGIPPVPQIESAFEVLLRVIGSAPQAHILCFRPQSGSQCTLDAVREHVAGRLDLPVARVKLVYQGHLIRDGTLAECGVEHMATVVAVLSPPELEGTGLGA